jgi:hypothetical protein
MIKIPEKVCPGFARELIYFFKLAKNLNSHTIGHTAGNLFILKQ